MQVYNLNDDAANKMVNIGVGLIGEGFKISGELAKEVLLVALSKVKETKENKVGIQSLRRLLKSKDELNVVNLNKEHLDYFKSQAKKLGVGFSAISDSNSELSKIIYKTKDVNLVKNIMNDILEKSKNENVIVEPNIYNILEKIDFKKHDDDELVYRHEVNNIQKEKAMLINKLLTSKEIENDVVVKDIKENNNLSVDYKVKAEDKEKAIAVIDSCRGKTVEQIAKEINSLNKVNAKNEVDEKNNSKEHVTLKDRIAAAEKELQLNTIKANSDRSKKKSRNKGDEER